jgi:hypothetical protein
MQIVCASELFMGGRGRTRVFLGDHRVFKDDPALATACELAETMRSRADRQAVAPVDVRSRPLPEAGSQMPASATVAGESGGVLPLAPSGR